MNNKRGQAALEFLMTYGWAIMVVLVVIGALSYFGVLNPSALMPERCTLEPGLGCADYKLTTSGANIKVHNGLGKPITVTDVNVTQLKGDGICGVQGSTLVNNGDDSDFTLTCTTAIQNFNRKESYNLTLTYYFSESSDTYNHLVQGEIFGKVQ